MDIVARKLNFVQEFLKISDEELISKLEKLLRTERKKRVQNQIYKITEQEFHQIIENSEEDIKNGCVTDSKELLKKVDINPEQILKYYPEGTTITSIKAMMRQSRTILKDHYEGVVNKATGEEVMSNEE